MTKKRGGGGDVFAILVNLLLSAPTRRLHTTSCYKGDSESHLWVMSFMSSSVNERDRFFHNALFSLGFWNAGTSRIVCRTRVDLITSKNMWYSSHPRPAEPLRAASITSSCTKLPTLWESQSKSEASEVRPRGECDEKMQKSRLYNCGYN